tara:strand:- start:82 stop:681 length:600 start_codon:yes stop_codon:yes gene_type:complete
VFTNVDRYRRTDEQRVPIASSAVVTGCKPAVGDRSLYRELDRIGRIRLSRSFFFRDFLHSEIAAAYGIINMPDNLDLAIETGSRLCIELLEPLQEEFGPIRIRSGYRSTALNAFGHKHHLNCASNKKNYAAHIWDRLDEKARRGASACVVIPSLFDSESTSDSAEKTIAMWARKHPSCDQIRFFKQPATFNIGWKRLVV